MHNINIRCWHHRGVANFFLFYVILDKKMKSDWFKVIVRCDFNKQPMRVSLPSIFLSRFHVDQNVSEVFHSSIPSEWVFRFHKTKGICWRKILFVNKINTVMKSVSIYNTPDWNVWLSTVKKKKSPLNACVCFALWNY